MILKIHLFIQDKKHIFQLALCFKICTKVRFSINYQS